MKQLLPLAFAAVFFPAACPAAEKIGVVATIFPVYDFARAIGKEKIRLSLLVPPGSEPHSFEPGPSAAAKIAGAAVFLHAGKLMEPWAESFAKGIKKNGPLVTDASAGIAFASSGGRADPHYWLDFTDAAKMCDNIASALGERDPENSGFYLKNAEALKKKLAALDGEYKAALSNCSGKTMVYLGHFAFGYVAKRYGLDYVSVQGVKPGSEPSLKKMAETAGLIKERGVKTVFTESFANSGFAKALASETGAKTVELNPLETLPKAGLDAGENYFSLMRANLKALSEGLKCGK